MCGARGPRCHAGGDGDRAGALEMEINGAKEEKGYTMSQILTDCDEFILLCILFCFDVIATVAL